MKPKEENKQTQVDLIQLFPTKFLKHKKKIDAGMKRLVARFKAEHNISGIIWGYGDHYKKEQRGKPNWYACFSNEESKGNELMFYIKRIPRNFNNEVFTMLKELKLIK